MGRHKKEKYVGISEVKFIESKARKLANDIHRDEHIIINKELPDHKTEWYYFMASAIYTNLAEKIDNMQVAGMDNILDEIIKLKEEMKEISKQQKYLWQTLEEIFPKKVEDKKSSPNSELNTN
jgi:hypothetical protein